jgi:hypothetical protein
MVQTQERLRLRLKIRISQGGCKGFSRKPARSAFLEEQILPAK